LSYFIETLKKSSSRWIKTLANLDHELTFFYWQKGYAAFTVSQSNLLAVKRYVDTQQEHHRQRSFQEEFRYFLQRHEINFDERFVWD